MAWDDFAGVDVNVTSSQVETARFGISLGRVSVGWELPASGPAYERAAEALNVAMAESSEDVLVVRYPAHVVSLGAVVAVSERSVLPAGALTYWGSEAEDVTAMSPRSPEGDLDVVTATDLPGSVDDVGRVVDAVIADSFAGYGNHYLANPLLDPDAVLAAYRDWARRSLEASRRDVLVLRAAGTPIGVATCVASRDGISHLEVLLAGVVSAAQGGGMYAVLLAGCALEARRRGLQRLIISTQVHNIRVQRAWARLGLHPFAAVETVHAVRAGLLGRIAETPVGYRSPVARD